MKITKKELIERAKSSKEVAQLIWNTPELLGVYGNKHISETEEVELTPEQEKAFESKDQSDQEIKDWAKERTEKENRWKNQK